MGVFRLNKALRQLTKPGVLPFVLLLAFAAAALVLRQYYLAAAAAAALVLLLLVTLLSWRRQTKDLAEYMEAALYETENAKSSTLMNFPLPIAIFSLEDSRIIWGNDAFFAMCGEAGTRLDATLAQLIP